MAKDPVVSVVTATYNRSNILKYTLSSLIRSEFKDWESIVVGDACTDDSADIVASFNDPRIKWINLKENFGEQSGPNNHGCALARGRYIAFLNHDDLWFPDHLSAALHHIRKWRCDLVYSMGATYHPGGNVSMNCISSSGRFEPDITAFASSWVFRRELLQEVGPWRSFRQTSNAPSNDWLQRAWRANKDLRMVPELTVVFVSSGDRENSYQNRDEVDNRRVFESLEDSDFKKRLCLKAIRSHAEQDPQIRIRANVKRLFRAIFYRLAMLLGISPRSITTYFKFRKHGGIIPALRRKRGLGPK